MTTNTQLSQYSDLLIVDGGLSLDVGAQPNLTNTRASIAQDVKHLLMESGLVTKLLAQRSQTMRSDVYTEMELLIETDTRLVPGSIELDIRAPQLIAITATTYEFGNINTEVIYVTPKS
ncbi:DUF2590 family protein [Shewanella sp. GutDb-MelDb]|uniref:DUF2590 family protein n=1 Tax=Shewanella sp. GutDb-MelDb TaxID=2058316 RepID=UPI000C7CBF56|nr:DUF2590 family protein [Shewanella sp. GutDb-MelDb]PKG57741.1 DUF2590 domain-containing protein [Shewanella sp. GutDb-MelDb]